MSGESVTKKQSQQKTKRCVACNRLFETSREHAKTCGQNCRQALVRKRKKVLANFYRATTATEELLKGLDDPLVQASAYRRLKNIKHVVSQTMIQADNSPYARQLALFEIAGG